MRSRRLLVALMLVFGIIGTASAQTAGGPHLMLNGKAVGTAPHIENGRLYVEATALATALGGSYAEDPATGVVTITTGSDLPTLAQLKELNPKLAQYAPISPFVPSMGFHHGVPGPHITLCVDPSGAINCVEMASPAEAGWFPWFDQPEGQPMEIEGLGDVYTQHIYLTDPGGIVPDNGIPVNIGGRLLSFPWAPKAHRANGQVFIPVRPAITLLGGSIGWDAATATATATLRPGPLTWEQLLALNSKLSTYNVISPFVPNMGFHLGAPGPHITVMRDSAGNVAGFETAVPAVVPWMPWFDQPEGQSMELKGLGKVWTQHIYIVDPNSIR